MTGHGYPGPIESMCCRTRRAGRGPGQQVKRGNCSTSLRHMDAGIESTTTAWPSPCFGFLIVPRCRENQIARTRTGSCSAMLSRERSSELGRGTRFGGASAHVYHMSSAKAFVFAVALIVVLVVVSAGPLMRRTRVRRTDEETPRHRCRREVSRLKGGGIHRGGQPLRCAHHGPTIGRAATGTTKFPRLMAVGQAGRPAVWRGHVRGRFLPGGEIHGRFHYFPLVRYWSSPGCLAY